MQSVNVKSWEEFQQKLDELVKDHSTRKKETLRHISDLLFRGQGDASWQLTTTLERYAETTLDVNDYYRAISAAKPQIESYTDQRWEIITPPDYAKFLEKQELGLFKFPAYEFMVYLRHNGFPSPLLDWSRSPFVAAFFAFRHASVSTPHVSIYAYLEYAGKGKSFSSASPHILSQGPYIRSHRRHYQQQCEYTICLAKSGAELVYTCHEKAFASTYSDQDLLWKFNVPSSEKLKVLRTLDSYNLNSFSLFGSEESLVETLAVREILF